MIDCSSVEDTEADLGDLPVEAGLFIVYLDDIQRDED